MSMYNIRYINQVSCFDLSKRKTQTDGQSVHSCGVTWKDEQSQEFQTDDINVM